PYYGDTLSDLVSGMTGNVAEVVVRGSGEDSESESFVADVIKEIGAANGIDDATVRDELGQEVIEKGPLNWQWVHAILKAIDRKVPFGSGSSVALFTNDVYQYLEN